MKKIIITLFTLLALSAMRATAQATAPRWSLSLEAGPAFPVGAFGTAYPTANAGNARSGFDADLSITYRFTACLGATFLGGLAQNPGHNGVIPIITPGGAYYETAQYKDWKTTRFLAGPTFESPLAANGRLSLQVRALAGILKTRIPDVTAYETSDPSSASSTFFGPMPWAFAYQLDAGLKWKIQRCLSLTLNAGYMASKPTSNVSWGQVEPDGAAIQSAQPISRTVDIGLIQLRAGLAFNF